MSTNIGPFEVLSELAKSPTGVVYKANDPESGQTVALKAIDLGVFGDSAPELVQALAAEAETVKALSSQNVAALLRTSEIEGKFCAAMEYVQGNSIATMLERKEGFSIWDLLDIGRQLCSALDHAAFHKVAHYSLEPAKIMCGWDGTVKILSYGVSSSGKYANLVSEGMPSTLHYVSPEQALGQPLDARSNFFSLGAVFYEMVTERKAFDRDDISSLLQSIVDSTPVAPIHVNPKVHPGLSDLIMKALEKDPAQRYQSGRELLDDLERCKESRPSAKAAPAAKAPVAKPSGPANTAAKAAAAGASNSGAIGSSVAKSSGLSKPPAPAQPSSVPVPVSPRQVAKPVQAPMATTAPVVKPSKLAMPRSAAAAAPAPAPDEIELEPPAPAVSQPSGENEVDLDLSNQFITSCVKATLGASEAPAEQMSAAMQDEPQIETFEAPVPPRPGSGTSKRAPKINVDPMMAEGPTAGSGTKFSEMTELPPLKEIYVAPPPPPPVHTPESGPSAAKSFRPREEKPKVQPREVAEKAIKEISTVPPKLMLYALGGAGVLILAIGLGVTYYIHNQNGDDDTGAANRASRAPEVAQQVVTQPPPVETHTQAPSAEPQEVAQPEPVKTHASKKRATPPPAPVILPGQISVDSTPQGAQVQLDGRSDPSWVTPLTISKLQPGQHTISISKSGYSTDSRTVNVTSGNLASLTSRLSQLAATLVVNSSPGGANIYVDGHDTGVKTPAQVSVNGGSHVVLVRKMGYIDETMNGQFVIGQTFNFSPALRELGNVDDIRTVGKMSRLLGGKGALPGQGTVSIHTQPKGAQVAVNQHLLEKNSPVDVALDPGNYEIDITMTGYAPIHKIISVDKSGKVVVDETMQRQ